MKNNFLKLLGCVAVVSLSFSACIKDDTVELTNQGSSFVKVLEAPENPYYFLQFTGTKNVDLFSVRLDANSSAELASPTTVKLTFAPELLADYNDENSTSIELLPDSIFTTALTKSANGYDLVIPAGQTGAEFTINLNGDKWDYSHDYAMPFVISDAGGKKLSDGKDKIIAFVRLKNMYDADYTADGYLYHPASPRAFNLPKHLGTTGPNSVSVDLGDLGGSGYRANLEIDPATNKITITAMPGAPAAPYYQFDDGLPASNPGYTAGWPGSAEIGSNGNRYDPDTHTFYLRYGYLGGTGYRISEEILTIK